MASRMSRFVRHVHNAVFYRTPSMLVYFVTARCNARCKMCFYEVSQEGLENELTLDEIDKISQSMGPIYWLLLSGGEPFLRRDLADLCRIFVRNNDVWYLQIPTNAWNARRIVETVRTILNDNMALPNFVVNVSVDHIGEKHDEIRGVSGLYEKMCETVRELHKVTREYMNFAVGANITYSGYNYRDISHIYETLKKTLPFDSIVLTLTRGTPREKEALDFTIENYMKVTDLINNEDVPYLYSGLIRRALGKGKNYYKEKIIESALEKKYSVRCRAGKNVGILGECGDVMVCEVLDNKLGNIRNFGYDFRRLWMSSEVKTARKSIWETKCNCTYECVIGPNVFSNPVFFGRTFLKGLTL